MINAGCVLIFLDKKEGVNVNCFLPNKDYDKTLKNAEKQAKLYRKISEACKKGKYGKAALLLGKVIIVRTDVYDI